MARWLALVAAFDERKAWAEWGCASCAHWIGWRCSITPGAAREHVRVARRLATLPVIQAAFARGELSYSKVRALTRLEAIDDENALLGLALAHTASQLDRVVRATRRVSREEAVDAQTERFLVLDPAEAGPANLSADALVRLADSVLVTGPCGRGTADRHEIVVHVDADALAAGDAVEKEVTNGAAANRSPSVAAGARSRRRSVARCAPAIAVVASPAARRPAGWTPIT